MTTRLIRVVVIALAIAIVAACQDKIAPTAPTAGPCTSTTAPSAQYAVSGTVTDREGRPIEGVEIKGGVFITKCGGGGFTVLTDSAGRFTGKLPSGTHSFSFVRTGYRTRSRQVIVSGETTVDETMESGIRLFGMVSEFGLPVTSDSSLGSLPGALIEIVDGVNKGTKVTSGDRSQTNYAFDDFLVAGTMRLRVTKEGFEPQERVITALDDVRQDFSLKWINGGCLVSVAPLLFDDYRSTGGTETVAVDVSGVRTWRVSTDDSWLAVEQQSNAGGGQFSFRIAPYPVGAQELRTGRLYVRCGEMGTQSVTVVQKPDCQIKLTASFDTPATFGPEGGVGGLLTEVGTAGCHWRTSSLVDWIQTSGIDRTGQPFRSVGADILFVVGRNTTGMARTGRLIVGETVWEVRQR